MSKKEIKCSGCGKVCHFPFVCKGPNNTYLCGGDEDIKSIGICGNNVCFKCGKVETRTIWVKSYNCQGEFMKESKVDMFSQFEKDENDPDLRLFAEYCDEHKEEAKKSSYKWTAEDDERLLRKQKEKELREEQKIEENLKNTKNLFYFLRQVRDESGQFYFAFLGIRNGQKYYLMVPSEHSVWNSNNPTVKQLEKRNAYGEKMLLLIHGVENISIGKNSPNYWKNLDRDTTESIFHKIIGLNDKIAVAEYIKLSAESKKDLKIVGGAVGALSLIIIMVVVLLLKRKNKI